MTVFACLTLKIGGEVLFREIKEQGREGILKAAEEEVKKYPDRYLSSIVGSKKPDGKILWVPNKKGWTMHAKDIPD